MIVLTEEEIRDTIQALEDSHPDFKSLYEDDTICPCCKINYDLWSFEKVNDWSLYMSRRFLLGE